MKNSLLVRPDCVYFKGEKPCKFKRVCDGCPQFKPFGPKILVIKCRAQGDVLRTTPVLTGLRRKYPDAFITWVVDEESLELLRDIPLIDRLLPLNVETALALQGQRFDAVYSLDKDPGLVALAGLVSAPRKFGFGLNEHGNLVRLHPGRRLLHAPRRGRRAQVQDQSKILSTDDLRGRRARLPERRLCLRPARRRPGQGRRFLQVQARPQGPAEHRPEHGRRGQVHDQAVAGSPFPDSHQAPQARAQGQRLPSGRTARGSPQPPAGQARRRLPSSTRARTTRFSSSPGSWRRWTSSSARTRWPCTSPWP